jgi:hypothetical protein
MPEGKVDAPNMVSLDATLRLRLWELRVQALVPRYSSGKRHGANDITTSEVSFPFVTICSDVKHSCINRHWDLLA